MIAGRALVTTQRILDLKREPDSDLCAARRLYLAAASEVRAELLIGPAQEPLVATEVRYVEQIEIES